MIVRAMAPSDLPSLIDLQEAGAVVAMADVFPQDQYPFPREAVLVRWRDEISDRSIGTYVAVDDDGQLVGFAATRGGELLHFGTALATWGQGTASELLGVMVDWLREASGEPTLRVFADNGRARRFYEKHGWRATGATSVSGFEPYPLLLEYSLWDDSPMPTNALYGDLQPATERIGLTERLDEERRAIVAQASDLSVDELHARPLAATDLSVGRIVKHLAFTEDRWFQHKLLGLELPEPWRAIDPSKVHDWSFESADRDDPQHILGLYDTAYQRSRDATAACPSMETLAFHPSFNNKPVNLRWLLAHMIDETAHHSGHIDLIRDSLGRPPVR